MSSNKKLVIHRTRGCPSRARSLNTSRRRTTAHIKSDRSTGKARPEWNSYLTDGDRFKPDEDKLLQRKKLLVSKHNTLVEDNSVKVARAHIPGFSPRKTATSSPRATSSGTSGVTSLDLLSNPVPSASHGYERESKTRTKKHTSIKTMVHTHESANMFNEFGVKEEAQQDDDTDFEQQTIPLKHGADTSVHGGHISRRNTKIRRNHPSSAASAAVTFNGREVGGTAMLEYESGTPDKRIPGPDYQGFRLNGIGYSHIGEGNGDSRVSPQQHGLCDLSDSDKDECNLNIGRGQRQALGSRLDAGNRTVRGNGKGNKTAYSVAYHREPKHSSKGCAALNNHPHNHHHTSGGNASTRAGVKRTATATANSDPTEAPWTSPVSTSKRSNHRQLNATGIPKKHSSFHMGPNQNDSVDPDMVQIGEEIRSLHEELRCYEELSGKRSILSPDDLEDALGGAVGNMVSQKALLKYLVQLVCHTMSYLLKSEVDLQSERGKQQELLGRIDTLSALLLTSGTADPQAIALARAGTGAGVGVGVCGFTVSDSCKQRGDRAIVSVGWPSLTSQADVQEEQTYPESADLFPSAEAATSAAANAHAHARVANAHTNAAEMTMASSQAKSQSLWQQSPFYVDAYESFRQLTPFSQLSAAPGTGTQKSSVPTPFSALSAGTLTGTGGTLNTVSSAGTCVGADAQDGMPAGAFFTSPTSDEKKTDSAFSGAEDYHWQQQHHHHLRHDNQDSPRNQQQQQTDRLLDVDLSRLDQLIDYSRGIASTPARTVLSPTASSPPSAAGDLLAKSSGRDSSSAMPNATGAAASASNAPYSTITRLSSSPSKAAHTAGTETTAAGSSTANAEALRGSFAQLSTPTRGPPREASPEASREAAREAASTPLTPSVRSGFGISGVNSHSRMVLSSPTAGPADPPAAVAGKSTGSSKPAGTPPSVPRSQRVMRVPVQPSKYGVAATVSSPAQQGVESSIDSLPPPPPPAAVAAPTRVSLSSESAPPPQQTQMQMQMQGLMNGTSASDWLFGAFDPAPATTTSTPQQLTPNGAASAYMESPRTALSVSSRQFSADHAGSVMGSIPCTPPSTAAIRSAAAQLSTKLAACTVSESPAVNPGDTYANATNPAAAAAEERLRRRQAGQHGHPQLQQLQSMQQQVGQNSSHSLAVNSSTACGSTTGGCAGIAGVTACAAPDSPPTDELYVQNKSLDHSYGAAGGLTLGDSYDYMIDRLTYQGAPASVPRVPASLEVPPSPYMVKPKRVQDKHSKQQQKQQPKQEQQQPQQVQESHSIIVPSARIPSPHKQPQHPYHAAGTKATGTLPFGGKHSGPPLTRAPKTTSVYSGSPPPSSGTGSPIVATITPPALVERQLGTDAGSVGGDHSCAHINTGLVGSGMGRSYDARNGSYP